MPSSTSQLERAIIALLDECAPSLRLSPRPLAKWIHVSKNQQQLKPVRDTKGSIKMAMALARNQYATLAAYERCRQLYAQDPIFGDGPRLAGYWATLDVTLGTVAAEAAIVRSHRVQFNQDIVRSKVRELRHWFGAASFSYDCRARLFGIYLSSKTVSLPDGVELRRLTLREIDERQPVSEPYFPTSSGDEHLGHHPTEARFRVTIPVDRTKDGAFFETGNKALAMAMEVFGRVADALTIVSGVPITFGQVQLLDGFERGGRPLTEPGMFGRRAKISKVSTIKVGTAYQILKDPTVDIVLGRALHRTILGHRRKDLVDRLVDYVIAWEAILLTHEGTALTQELSYRFAVNGSVLLAKTRRRTQPRDLYHKMRSAYAARSCVVHGTNTTALDRALRIGGFQNISELCQFLESSLRDAIFWLQALVPANRPYRKRGGWDELLWA